MRARGNNGKHKAFCTGCSSKQNTSYSIRERGSVLYLGMAKEISILPYWCTSRITANEDTTPQTKHADRMIATA